MRAPCFVLSGMLIGFSLLPLEATAKDWEELNQFDVVTFIIPASAPQPDAPTDKVIFTGGKIIDVDVTGCGAGVHALQHYTILDPTGQRSQRNGGIISTSTSAPVPPGTRLGLLSLDSPCRIGQVVYFKYTGVVE